MTLAGLAGQAPPGRSRRDRRLQGGGDETGASGAEQTKQVPSRAEQTRQTPSRAEQTRQAPTRAEQTRPLAVTGT